MLLASFHLRQSFQDDFLIFVFVEFPNGDQEKIVLSNPLLFPQGFTLLLGERLKCIQIKPYAGNMIEEAVGL